MPGGFARVELISDIESAGLEVTDDVGTGIGGLDLVGVARKIARSDGEHVQVD